MRIAHLLAIAVLCLAGCASTPAADHATATYLLVRHAEKDLRVADDPPLTADGIARAREAIASGVARAKLDEFVSTTQSLARTPA